VALADPLHSRAHLERYLDARGLHFITVPAMTAYATRE